MEIEQSQSNKDACRATESTETNEIEETKRDPFCSGRCAICDSGYADRINQLRNEYTLRELSEYLKEEYGLQFSKDQLCLHFQKYNAKLRDESLALAYQSFRIESMHVAEHQKQVLFLASFTFEELLKRIQNGTLKVGIEEFEKMLKLYYQILRDPDGAQTPDITEIYMRATKHFKIPLEQRSFDFATQGVANEPKEPNAIDALVEKT